MKFLRTSSSKLFKGRSRFLSLMIGILKWGIGLVVLISIFGMATNNKSKGFSDTWENTKKVFVKQVVVPEEVEEFNKDGTANGINLLLIDKIPTECFTKEYLTIARDNWEGKLNGESSHTPVDTVIGLTMAEQGAYPGSGGVLPCTCLPWDSSTNSPKWIKDTEWTLAKADYSVLQNNHYSNAWTVGSYVGPFQQTASYFTNGKYRPSNMNGKSHTPGRSTGDWSYFPDQLAGLDNEISSVNGIDVNQVPEKARAAMASLNHNVGESWKRQFLSTYKGGDLNQGVNALMNSFQTQFDKYQSQLSSRFLDISEYKWVAAFLLMEDGWNVCERPGDGMTSYHSLSVTNANAGFNAFTTLGLGSSKEEYQAYLSNHNKQDPSNYGNCMHAATQGTMWKDCGGDGKMYMLTETAGHILCSTFMGPIFYARMLVYAGVTDVDPTNPTTYMNYDNEWNPSGVADWLLELGVDTSKLNDKRVKTLNAGHKLLGTYYGHNRPVTEPNYDSSGQAIPGTGNMDCSGFVEFIIRQATGVSISYPQTDAFLSSPYVEFISPSEMKPGDIIVLGNNGKSGTEHVIMYISGDCSTANFTYIHTGSNPDGVCVKTDATWQRNNRKDWYYLRVKCLDD